MTKRYTFTRAQCGTFLQNPRNNPKTGKVIQPGKEVFIQLIEQCRRYGMIVNPDDITMREDMYGTSNNINAKTYGILRKMLNECKADNDINVNSIISFMQRVQTLEQQNVELISNVERLQQLNEFLLHELNGRTKSNKRLSTKSTRKSK